MKHLKLFESVTNPKDNSINRINDEIEVAIDKYDKNTDKFYQYDTNKLRINLLEKAKENNYRGSVVIRRSVKSGKYHIIYEPKRSTLQEIGFAARGY
jgi:hypothetical protein